MFGWVKKDLGRQGHCTLPTGTFDYGNRRSRKIYFISSDCTFRTF